MASSESTIGKSSHCLYFFEINLNSKKKLIWTSKFFVEIKKKKFLLGNNTRNLTYLRKFSLIWQKFYV